LDRKNNLDGYGSYINGKFVSVNGYKDLGLLCPRGVRLYDINHPMAVFAYPKNIFKGEIFVGITQDIAPKILPYYAISNYGRILQIYTGNIMKVNYRPNGYAYMCLAAEDKQRKYTLHRLVMLAFRYFPGCEELQVNHIDGDKTHNFVDIPDKNGNLYSNLEWVTAKENSKHAIQNNLRSTTNVLNEETVKDMCMMFEQGYRITDVWRQYKHISYATIQAIYEHKNWKGVSDKYSF
jgi:hypothetical protein